MNQIKTTKFMQLALQNAQKGTGSTWTNPLVGAVIVKDQKVLATGYHHHFGGRHAEIDALKNLAKITDAQGATMYVTLEPCSHFGKTPPCARTLVKAGISRVVIGQRDPNPLVAGKGIAILAAAGIAVQILGQTGGLNAAYNFFYEQHRPLVTLKYAMSLDGKINANAGVRSILTGKKAYADSQLLRRSNQAILIGEHTFKVDDPLLTVRQTVPEFEPLRIILVNDADEIDLRARLFKAKAPILLLSRRQTQRKWPAGVEVHTKSDWKPKQILNLLADKGIQSLLVEGGSRIQADFIAADVVEHLVVYVAPVIYGGGGLPAVFGTSAHRLAQYQLVDRKQLAQDTRFELRRN
ncbi:bifunctional diaminohydroxyphosphoribosylaminopyrimidine deaminase/5-amino-6-(5-phosphoribosylamino)uracil reductase RibD [Liquorilactobacillus satsumensis]|uniref:bifunctional diaminohydroxyphosphoribosylaminopyrimidine deaminase/5-amino-6-(5-phosphoribosylamino)uracil reductase RibD n=1 Tax=Liquorilactobacillus satsumensis TaxID=259059 RepID=UPI0021C3AF7A|nr:bifunctional diaminohydroxyphosphoribosylaminopyrimidine deaminase/5-amino-6-(5-phosphoribosylamino)uracil reductase RibD [Liquorilactobacillus satsumensis]